MRLIYSEIAVTDLIRLRAFIAEKDPAAASRIAGELIQRIELLEQFPDLGRPVEQAPDPTQIRDSIFGNYIVRYAKTTDTVAILRIWHHAEDRTLHT